MTISAPLVSSRIRGAFVSATTPAKPGADRHGHRPDGALEPAARARHEQRVLRVEQEDPDRVGLEQVPDAEEHLVEELGHRQVTERSLGDRFEPASLELGATALGHADDDHADPATVPSSATTG